MERKITGRELNALTGLHMAGAVAKPRFLNDSVYTITPCGGLILEGGFNWPEPKGTDDMESA
jgi:hypothetical protein